MGIEKYLDNITSQHRDKPKFISWLSSNLNKIDDIYLTIKSIDSAFDLDNAIGKQLDTLGELIGRQRVLTFQPLNGHDPVLDDETYRLALKAKVAMNKWDGTIPSAYEIWNNMFNDIGLEIEDKQDMSFNAYVTGYVNQIRQDLIQHGYIVPKPEGVRVNYIGKSPIELKPYCTMIVSISKSEFINMDYNPNPTIESKEYPYLIVQGLNKVDLNLNGGDSSGII